MGGSHDFWQMCGDQKRYIVPNEKTKKKKHFLKTFDMKLSHDEQKLDLVLYTVLVCGRQCGKREPKRSTYFTVPNISELNEIPVVLQS